MANHERFSLSFVNPVKKSSFLPANEMVNPKLTQPVQAVKPHS